MARFGVVLSLPRLFTLTSIAILLAATAHAQIPNMDDTTIPPTPGVGHDYIKMLGETVNPANGSVSLRIDLPMPKGRGVDVPFAILYSSSGVEHVIGNPNGGGAWANDTGSSSGSGWGLSIPTLTSVQGIQSQVISYEPPQTAYCYYYYSYVMRDWMGASHQLGTMQGFQNPYDGGTSCYLITPSSNSNLTGGDDFFQGITTIPANPYWPDPVTVAGPDGTVYKFTFSNANDGSNVYSYWGATNSIEDRNGNLVYGSFQNYSGIISGSLQDTLGRTVVSVSPLASNANTISVSGLSASYTQTWGSVPVSFNINQTQGGSYPCTNPQIGPDHSSNYVIRTLTLPNGKVFQFYYDSAYGLLNKIVYPTGGYISYTWGLNPQSEFIETMGYPVGHGFVCDMTYDSPAITQRTVSYDGVHVAEQQSFSYATSWPPPLGGGPRWTTKQTTVTTEDCARATSCSSAPSFQTTYTYFPTLASVYAPQYAPMEQTIVYKDFGGTTLKTVTKAWIDQFLLGCELDTLDTGSIAGIWYFYGAGGQMTDKKEYDYGLVGSTPCQQGSSPGPVSAPPSATPTRETVTGYQTFPSTPIYPSGSSIFDRSSSIKVYGNGASAAETDFGYDETGVGSVTATGHDDTNYGASFNVRANLTTATRKCFVGATGCTNAVSKYSYDQTGQALSIIDPCGNTPCSDMTGTNHTTVFSYTDNYQSGSGTPPGNTNAYVTTITRLTVNGVTAHEYFQYAYSDAQLTASQDDNQKTASRSNTYSYADSLRRLTQTGYADGGTVTLSYDDTPLSANITKTTLIDSAAGLNLGTKTIFDGLGHSVQVQLTTDPDGTDKSDITYDGLGHVWKRSNPYRSTGDSTYGNTTYNYDALGRTTSVAQSDGSTVSITYAGSCTTITDETLKARKSCSDALGRLTSVLEDPGTAPHLNYETDYQYDGLGNLLRVDQKGDSPGNSAAWRTRLFTYDSLSQLPTAANPESGTISYSYDANGNLKKRTSPKPNQTSPAITTNINYCYDALNRVTSKAYTSTACPPSPAVATYTYDQGTNGIGNRTGMTDTPGSSSWTYDLMGRILSETRISSGVTRTTSYVYNLDGSVKSITYPSTHTVNYTYGGAGRALSAIDPTGPINYVTSATYAPPGELATYTNGFVSGGFAGIATANFYNSRLQPCRLSAGTGSIPSLCGDNTHSGSVLDLTYNFNAGTSDNGNVVQIVNNRDSNRTQNFVYDNLNRILQGYTSGTNWGEDFTIDAWANLTNRSLHAGKTNYEPLNGAPAFTSNQLTGFGYDAAGNITSNGTIGYNYDQENRLTKFITNVTDIYIYDGDGERVKKSVPAVTLYWYGATGNVLDETGGTGTLVSEYIFFNGKRVARRDADNSVKYYFADNLGSASVITNATGAMPPLEESDYYPYGGEIPITSGDPNHYKFTGKERDPESSLDYFGARHYASTMGRFMTADQAADETIPVPLPWADFRNPQSLNLYSYALNNPVTYVDPDGHDVHVCVDNSSGGQNCFNMGDQQYADLQKQQNGQNGINMPGGGLPNGNITCGGQVCGSATYFEPGLKDTSLDVAMFIGGVASLGRGLIEGGLGLLRGAGEAGAGTAAREAGAAVAEQVVAKGGKAAIRDALESGAVNELQKQAVKRALARGAAADSFTVEKLADGSIRITREVAGGSGGLSRATYESVVDAGGNSVPGTALQRGYNAAGELNHVDPK